MKFTIKHESRGRMRVHMEQYRMTYEQADTLLYVIHNHRNVTFVKVYDRTADAVIEYVGDREQIIELLRHFHYESANVPQTVIKTSGRELNNSYQEKLIGSVVWHYSKKLLLPLPIRIALTIGRSVKYIGIGLKCLLQRKIEVPVLDATAITVSLVTKDFSTASSIMFLLGIGELLEEWTHKKSVDDLARSMSLNVSKVWLKTPENQEILVESSKIEKGDKVVVHMGNVIPFDGEVLDGDAMVNQASLTGESVPVQRTVGNTVFAGTVVEEGEITIRVKEVEGNNRFDQIVTMIEESEKLKSELEGKAEHYADKLVPWTLGATGLTYLLTRNVTKAMSILMVDFCCALKLAMPISVLSAIREASLYNVTVKGGKFLEAVAEADTIVFDKTGTLTQGVFDVTGVHHNTMPQKKVLEYAALAECASSHPISKSLREACPGLDAKRASDAQEIAGHGVKTQVDGRTVLAGNARLMEKLGLAVPAVDGVGTIVHVAVEGSYAGYLLISDVVKPHSADAIRALKASGVRKTVMLTGDAQPVAQAVAQQLGLDEYHAGLLPGDKVDQIEKLLAAKQPKENLAFVGDGINDAPVLSRADVGIAMGALGSDAAIEAADVVLMDDDPAKIALAMRIARRTLRIVHQNIVFALGIKALCLLLGALGIAGMWAAIFADVGVMVIAVLNATRALYTKDLTKN